ncbi:MAG: alpha/beta hydrolase [Caldilineaceae bacterium]
MNTSIDDFRAMCEKGAARAGKLPAGVDVAAEEGIGLPAEWIIPLEADADAMILYVHGGGYVSGSLTDHRSFVAKIAHGCGVRTLHYEYRLAPEHPFPAALDDSVAVYRWLLENGRDPHKIVVAGESAGGGLTLGLMLALKGQKIELPAAAVAISPWTDLTCSSASYRTKGRVSVAPTDSWLVFSRHYAGDQPADQPLISPLFGDLDGLPPLFINAGEDDELFDDGRLFAEKATAAGVDVTFRAGEGMVHCYPLMAPLFPEATEALDEICAFVKTALADGQ